MHRLTKSKFLTYLACPPSMWLALNKPDLHQPETRTEFQDKLASEGYAVEAYAKQLFPGAVDLPEYGSPEQTRAALADASVRVWFQPTFVTERNAFARVDVLEREADGGYHLYEIKSTSSLKTSGDGNHIWDLAFQRYVLEAHGLRVNRCSVIHLNKDFVKRGEIQAAELLTCSEATERVEAAFEEITRRIEEALEYLNLPSIDEAAGCPCRFQTKRNHCPDFAYFNGAWDEPTIYDLGGIRRKALSEWLEKGYRALRDVPADEIKSRRHRLQQASLLQGAPVIDRAAVHKLLDDLVFPLYFYDYEAFGAAVPVLEGTGPHQQVPFQVSIHRMEADGTLTHYEYLAEGFDGPEGLLEFMASVTGMAGTFISWHQTYENTRNKEMAVLAPAYAEYLDYVVAHTFDLEDVFKEAYVDYRFGGSTSIKKVLPVVVPSLSYDELPVNNGTAAMDTWGKWAAGEYTGAEREQVRRDLLAYCELDTLAMVEIYRVLVNL